MVGFDQILANLPVLLSAAFTAVLFIQSFLDKVFDRKGNLGWLTGHFEKTPLAGMVPMMLATVTIMEIATGILAAAGVIYFIFTGSTVVIFWASVVGAVSILALFFGQRIAKDYPGAAVLVPYFVLMLIMMVMSQAPTFPALDR
jgi:hypothetical protein